MVAKFVHCLIPLLLLLHIHFPATVRAADIDLQSRFIGIVTASLNEKWQIRAGITRIYFNDISELELQSFYAGPYYTISKGLKTGLEYRHMDKQINGQWVPEDRVSSVLVLRKKYFDWHVVLRKRLEYRSRAKGYGVEWRGRSFLKIAARRDSFIPYLSNELFYNIGKGRLNRYKFQIGVDIPVAEKLKTGIYYEYETEKFSREWEGLHIVGSSLVLLL